MQPASSAIKYSATQLAQLLSQSRFYGAKGVGIADVQVLCTAPLLSGDRGCALVILKVLPETSGDTPAEPSFYQLCLPTDSRPDADELQDLLAEGDPAALNAVLQAYRRQEAPGALGSFTATDELPIAADAEIKVMTGEQSNTSVIIRNPGSDTGLMLKFFRKLEAGLNPDVELLSYIGDCPAVAAVRGYVELEDPHFGGRATLAMLQDLVPGAHDAWEVALESARNDDDPATFADSAEAMGAATARVHQALGAAFGVDLEEKSVLLAGFRERLDAVIAQAPQLAKVRTKVLGFYKRLDAELPEHVQVQRIHGDLHLGQILRSGEDRWVLIDFEGEPARPLSERRKKDSALRDVAGMLRSFDYAAYVAKRPAPQPWVDRCHEAFLRGYGRVASSPLMDAYVLDKALYEVAYEINNRPTWVHIPLGAVERIIGSLADGL